MYSVLAVALVATSPFFIPSQGAFPFSGFWLRSPLSGALEHAVAGLVFQAELVPLENF